MKKKGTEKRLEEEEKRVWKTTFLSFPKTNFKHWFWEKKFQSNFWSWGNQTAVLSALMFKLRKLSLNYQPNGPLAFGMKLSQGTWRT